MMPIWLEDLTWRLQDTYDDFNFTIQVLVKRIELWMQKWDDNFARRYYDVRGCWSPVLKAPPIEAIVQEYRDEVLKRIVRVFNISPAILMPDRISFPTNFKRLEQGRVQETFYGGIAGGGKSYAAQSAALPASVYLTFTHELTPDEIKELQSRWKATFEQEYLQQPPPSTDREV